MKYEIGHSFKLLQIPSLIPLSKSCCPNAEEQLKGNAVNTTLDSTKNFFTCKKIPKTNSFSFASLKQVWCEAESQCSHDTV